MYSNHKSHFTKCKTDFTEQFPVCYNLKSFHMLSHNRNIGINIKKFRSFKGKKQIVLAGEIGVSRIMLSRYENGRSTISLQQLQKIANCLGVTIDQLVYEENNC